MEYHELYQVTLYVQTESKSDLIVTPEVAVDLGIVTKQEFNLEG